MDKEATTSGRDEEGGRSRKRDRSRSRAGRERGVHSTTADAILKLISQSKINKKRKLAKTSASARTEYQARIMAMQTERNLLPDAPPRKRPRNNTPERVPCRLVEGTPEVPPPPKPRSWQKRRPIVREKASTSSSSVPSPPNPQSRQTHIPEPACAATLPMNLSLNLLGDAPQSAVLASALQPLVSESPQLLTITSCSDGLNLLGDAPQSAVLASALQPLVSESPQLLTITSCSDGLNLLGDAPQSAVLASALQPLVSESPQLLTITSRSDDDPVDQLILERLEQKSDAEEDESGVIFEYIDIDYTTREPVHLPEDMDDNCAHFLKRQDDDSDRLLSQLLTGDTTEHMTFDWTNDKDTFQGRRENFVGPSGPTFALETTDRPLDVFLRYFDDEVFNLIVSESNRICDQLTSTGTFTEHSRFNRMKRTDKSEIGIFLAVLVLQGLLPLPVERDYFSENGYLTLKNFKSIMSYNRFILLKRLLHFTDNNDASTVDNNKLRKLGPLLNLLQSKFKGLYLPSRNITIDESLLKWLGRLSFSQKIATKAAKVGIKTYELCESSTGYCWNFFIYTGKGHTHDGHDKENTDKLDKDGRDTKRQDNDRRDTDRQETDGQDTERQDNDRQGHEPVMPSNLTAQIVLDLVRPLLNRGHTLVMDNFYNSPLLARYLKKNKTDCFGTLRVNRDFVPEAIKYASKSLLRPGEMVQSYCRDLSVVLWCDNSMVALISTIHAGEVGGKEKNGIFRYKPQVVLDYNLAMGGVDKKDQLLSAHPMERQKNQVWYKKVFRRLLNVTILNAYIVYKTQHPRTSQREFRTSLANEMIATFRPPQVERPLDDLTVREVCVVQKGNLRRPILEGNHFIGTSRSRFSRCVYCKNARTKYICKQCDVSLCLATCFENFHTVV